MFYTLGKILIITVDNSYVEQRIKRYSLHNKIKNSDYFNEFFAII